MSCNIRKRYHFITVINLLGQKEWYPVHIEYHKGDISPCVFTVEGRKQIFDKVDVRNERAIVAFSGKKHIYV